jgi:glycosyltransferase involved in cell wall biosynthesis
MSTDTSKACSHFTLPPERFGARLNSLTPLQNVDVPVAKLKRVLFISYAFPPVGGAGVQRVTKFVKYLPHQGWLPSVLTVANPSVPAWDPTLLKDIPAQTIIRRAETLEPGYKFKSAVSNTSFGPRDGGGSVRRFIANASRRLAQLILQPDPQVLWLPDAIRQGKRMLGEISHAAIIASGPPFSAFLVGKALARHSGVPLILDYRDEWDLSSAYLEHKSADRFSLLLKRRMQRSVLRAARAVLTTTKASAAAVEEIRKKSGGDAHVECFYNGFDPDDFAETTSETERSDFYRLVYVGTLWNLTSVAPLVEAVRRLAEHEPALISRLELVFAGRRTPEQQQIVNNLKQLPCRIVEHGYVAHENAISLMVSADVLCTLLSDLPGAGRVVPAKLFEYMATGRPILAIAPRGEMGDLLSEYPPSQLIVPADVVGIARYLATGLRKHLDGVPDSSNTSDISRYSRAGQTRQLAELLNSLC